MLITSFNSKYNRIVYFNKFVTNIFNTCFTNIFFYIYNTFFTKSLFFFLISAFLINFVY